MLPQLLTRQHLTPVREQTLQQLPLGPGQQDLTITPPRLMSAGVHTKIRHLQNPVVLPRHAAPHQGADPRQQLLELEGLHQIVIRAGVETGNAITGQLTSRQHQDRNLITLATKPPRQLQPGDPWQADVQHHAVEGRQGERDHRVLASRGVRDLVTLEHHRPKQTCRQRWIILDHQHPHGSP